MISAAYLFMSQVLWGIPYDMRPGQSPGDLWRARRDYVPLKPGQYGSLQISLDDWVYLGQPGWWGSIPRDDQKAVKAFLESLREKNAVPTGPNEWVRLADFD